MLADSGEDQIAFSTESDFAANVELAEALAPEGDRPGPGEAMRLVDTPDAKTIDDLVQQFDQPIEKTVKTLVVEASGEVEAGFVALLVRGDHVLNEFKAVKLPQVASPLRFAEDSEILEVMGVPAGAIVTEEASRDTYENALYSRTVLSRRGIERVLLCSGKLYYALQQRQQALKDRTSAIVRIEQFYPFPEAMLRAVAKRYRRVKQWLWVQEEQIGRASCRERV